MGYDVLIVNTAVLLGSCNRIWTLSFFVNSRYGPVGERKTQFFFSYNDQNMWLWGPTIIFPKKLRPSLSNKTIYCSSTTGGNPYPLQNKFVDVIYLD